MEIKELLSQDAFSFFETLSPSYQKAYTNHIFSAKTDATKQKRILEVEAACQARCKNVLEFKKLANPERISQAKNMDVDQKFAQYFSNFDAENAKNVLELVTYLEQKYQGLQKHYAWNSPMFTCNDTFIIGISMSTKHFTISVENTVLNNNRKTIEDRGYETTKCLFKIKYSQAIDYELMDMLVQEQLLLKADCQTFWFKDE